MAFLQIIISLLCLAEAHVDNELVSISISRHHKGDVFTAQGEKCYKDLCVGLSSGTAKPAGTNGCQCKCVPNLPVFRDDLNICVDDIQECTLVPFISGTTVKKIPFVFLPLKGQIVYPSAEIIISDLGAPVCVVSGGKFLGRNGWINLRNSSSADPPFRLFRDEGRTYLQWLGESSLRTAMEGRLILVHLMCKDANAAEEPKIFTPCIAFRVAGNPSIREVMFATDVQQKEEGGGLSTREYIAIGICSLLLAIVYAISVFVYLNIRKRKNKKSYKKNGEDAQLTLGEEGVIKSNPLLQATRHLSVGGQDNAGYISDSNSCCSDPEPSSDLLCMDDEDLVVLKNVQTSAMVHPCDLDYGDSILNQDANNIEKLPEENVSIVETLEGKDEHPETIRGMSTANVRRKLYFNPSYFEPDLLKAPPPAALEFLMKIREVIAIAKHKMSAKKFNPSLLGIPEEDGSSKADCNSVLARNSTKTSESENRRNSKASAHDRRSPPIPEVGNFQVATEFCSPSDVKQSIIRKWLEDVPIMGIKNNDHKSKQIETQKAEDGNISKSKPKVEERMIETTQANNTNNRPRESKDPPIPPQRHDKKRPSNKGRAPPLPPQRVLGEKPESENGERKKSEKLPLKNELSSFLQSRQQGSTFKPCFGPSLAVPPPRPPPLPSPVFRQEEVPRLQGKDHVTPAVTKNLMDAVIQELTGYRKNDKDNKSKEPNENKVEKEVLSEDEADVKENKKKEIDPVNNRQDNDEKFSSMCSTSRKNSEIRNQDDHEYEVILLNTDLKPETKNKDLKIYNLPELLSKSDRNEGYSLVSEVYVNDGYSSCSSNESPSSSYSNSSGEGEKISYEMREEKPGHLTIHVEDSPERYKNQKESDNFEPDTLDRKPNRSKLLKRITEGENDRYSNQRFHDMDCYRSNQSANNEIFTDSLERPTIMLKTNGSFKKNSVENELNHFFRNLEWAKAENFGSLREIYEAKSKSHKRRTETTSLVDSINSDTDCISTLSWSEEKRNKLLHHGIILHIANEGGKRHKKHCRSQVRNNADKPPIRPPKPCPSPRSGSASPVSRSRCTSPSKTICRYPSPVPPRSTPPRTTSPPAPPPRSVQGSPPPPNFQVRSANSSPVTIQNPSPLTHRHPPPPPVSPNNSVFKIGHRTPMSSLSGTSNSFSSLPPGSSPPPRPPKVENSPPLPPRNSKPPIPPKHGKTTKQKGVPSKFATRPLPPLPHPRLVGTSSSSTTYKDLETSSVMSGASMDSLNSSEYEAFYTLPYEEQETNNKNEYKVPKTGKNSPNTIIVVPDSEKISTNHMFRSGHKKSWREVNRAIPHRPDDSGYLSTDSNESYCPQMILPSQISKIPEKVESCYGGQNSETEESFGDGASESGGESIATDSFFYGNFPKKSEEPPEGFPYTLRRSDVEVNSDAERHCVPIMVRP